MGQVMQGKIYVAKDKTRMETAASITISRMDKQVIWVLMPQQRTYMEMPMDQANTMVAGSEKIPNEVERKLLGKETVNGVSADKYRIVYTSKDTRMVMYSWLDPSGFPVKSAAEDGSWSMEYRNLVKGKPSADKFDLPAGYTKMSLPSLGNLFDLEKLKGLDLEEN